MTVGRDAKSGMRSMNADWMACLLTVDGRICLGIPANTADRQNIHQDHKDIEGQCQPETADGETEVIEAVEQDGLEKAVHHKVLSFSPVTVDGVHFGGAEVGAEEDREGQMRRDREEGPGEQDAGAVGDGIEDIFKGRKAQGGKGHVDNAVEAVVEEVSK